MIEFGKEAIAFFSRPLTMGDALLFLFCFNLGGWLYRAGKVLVQTHHRIKRLRYDL